MFNATNQKQFSKRPSGCLPSVTKTSYNFKWSYGTDQILEVTWQRSTVLGQLSGIGKQELLYMVLQKPSSVKARNVANSSTDMGKASCPQKVTERDSGDMHNTP